MTLSSPSFLAAETRSSIVPKSSTDVAFEAAAPPPPFLSWRTSRAMAASSPRAERRPQASRGPPQEDPAWGLWTEGTAPEWRRSLRLRRRPPGRRTSDQPWIRRRRHERSGSTVSHRPTIPPRLTMDVDPLAVDPETMRRLGHLVVDRLADRAAARREEPVLRQASPDEMARRVPGEAPRAGESIEAILDHLETDVLPFRSRIDHPRYLAYVPGEGTWPGALGDLVAAAYNIDVGNWMESAGPSRLEEIVLGWFADWIGYPDTARGVLVSGGSAAHLTALACAREALVGAMRPDVVAYVSEQGHSSLARACRVLGFRREQVRVLPVDERCRMRLDALEASIRADLDAGHRPLVVLAVAGTTNTGAVDDLPAIAETCRRFGVWMHVDGAYGGFAAVTRRGREALRGLELADSVTLDPHKWLYQPFECGAVLVRVGRLLREAFEIHPTYLQDTASKDGEVNFAERGLQLTRMSRALKVWVSLRYFGFDAFAAAVERAMEITEEAERRIDRSAELEVLAPATLGVVCFRRRPPGWDDEA